MNKEITLNRFRLLSGLSDEEAFKWLPVIKDSIDYVNSLVTKEELTERELERIGSAAGVYAYYRYVACGIEKESSVKLGELSVSNNTSGYEQAERMWQTQKDELADLFGNSDFVFKRVR